jgi:hypothetical protein
MLIAAVRITLTPHETALGPTQLCLHNFQDFLHAPFVACQSRGRGMRLTILAGESPASDRLGKHHFCKVPASRGGGNPNKTLKVHCSEKIVQWVIV